MENLQDAKIYMGTYKKYNEGSIEGEWLELSEYSDKEEFLEACGDLHSDEEDPEFMFQDWENIPNALIGESWLSEKFFELRDKIEDMEESESEAFMAWLDYHVNNINKEDLDDLVTKFSDDYCGQYASEEDFAVELVDDCYTLPEFAKTYFDYEKFARDLFTCDYNYIDGFVFRNC
ncbi:antirestriction protein ArdA [Butyricimonas virosa]|uniref:antirestriction protein ArdA n=1 Tax=Butyricimonas virosa TaxID=544645 RepID=UPI0032BFD41C